MNTVERRTFLRTAAGSAALTLTSRLSSFGNNRSLKIAASMPGAELPYRLPPD
jgi:hypothetical protein